MKIKCNLIFAEITFVDEKRWSKCWSKCCLMCWLDVAWRADPDAVWWFDEVVRDLHPTLRRLNALTDLRCFAKRLHLTLWRSDALAGFRICQRAASDDEAVRCTGGFSVLPERLHLTLRRSDALTDWQYQKCCTQRWCRRMHWRFLIFFFETQVRRFSRCLGYRCSGEILTDWRRQAGR